MLVNRNETVIRHLAATGELHPIELYRALIALAGELATFTETGSNRPPELGAYNHNDLQASFTPVIGFLRESLSAVFEQTAIPIPPSSSNGGPPPSSARSLIRMFLPLATTSAQYRAPGRGASTVSRPEPTSRAPLRISSEHEYRVPPLAVPAIGTDSVGDVERSAAAILYVERARRSVPDFGITDENAAAIARICRALEGMPLALELAAARVRLLGAEGTAEQASEQRRHDRIRRSTGRRPIRTISRYAAAHSRPPVASTTTPAPVA